MRLLVCGAGGMLGHDVQRAAARTDHELTALDRAALDITDSDAVTAACEHHRPDVVINCAAYTNVDGAESDEPAATLLNGEAAANVAAAAAAVGAGVVHPSTDYVFDGRAARPYVESDPVDPQSAYGRSKLAGELAVAEANPRHWIVRTAWLFGVDGKNFVETMLTIGGRDGRVSVVADQVGSPTWTGHLAAGLIELATGDAHGIHHMSAAGACSWYDFAVAIFEDAGVACEVTPTTSDEFVRPAPRPAYSVLGTERDDSIGLPDWRTGLGAYLGLRQPEGA